MLGTSPETMGGVASVIRIYQACGLFSRWPVTYLSSHVDGSPGKKIRKALVAWLVFCGWLVRNRKFVLHVHCASHWSFWRKSAFIVPAAWTGKAVIFHLHGAEFMHFYGQSSPLAKSLVRYVLDSCTRIIVLSDKWRASISGITTTALEVIANPALPLRNDLAQSRDSHTLLFLGRLGKRKGIHVLLHALVKVREDYPGVRLLCGGDGDLEEVRALAHELGIESNVEILGWIDEERRSELMRSACVYVLPSYAEGLPMSVLEAMSAGLPVVTTPVGGIPDAITDGAEGLLVPPGDAEALAGALCRLLGDPSLRAAMGSRGRARFDACYDASVVLPRLEAMYRTFGINPTGCP